MVIKLAMRWPAPARFSSSCCCSLSFYGRASIGSTSRAYIATTTDALAPVADELAAIAAAQPRDRLFWFGGDDDDSRTWWGSCHSVEPAPTYEPTATALVLFFGGWLAWKNDLNGTWCFRRGSPLYWLQGHAVWHVLTMAALACIYWFFRSEKISYS